MTLLDVVNCHLGSSVHTTGAEGDSGGCRRCHKNFCMEKYYAMLGSYEAFIALVHD